VPPTNLAAAMRAVNATPPRKAWMGFRFMVSPEVFEFQF
jgi:hypothetical protein